MQKICKFCEEEQVIWPFTKTVQALTGDWGVCPKCHEAIKLEEEEEEEG